MEAGGGADNNSGDSAVPSSSAKTSFLKTCFNGVNALSGIGLLSIPYALSQGGWLSLIVFLAIAVICFYTGLLLQRCMDSSSLVTTYPDIGALAFGRRGRLAVATFMYLELYLVAIDFLILEGDNLHKLFPEASFRLGGVRVGGKQAFVVAATLAVLPTTWFSSLNVLAYVAAGGALASVVLIAAVLWVGVFDGVGFHERGRLVNWAGMPSAMSLYSFCFSGHAVFPMIYTGMKDRRRFPMVLLICFAVSTLSYGFMGVVGYLMYGDSLMSQVTLNLPSGKASSKVAIYTTLVNPLTKYALVVAPVAEAVEAALGGDVPKSRPLRMLVRTGLVVGTAVVALAVPFFADVVALTGALLSCTATMLLPCLCYLKVRSKMGYRKPRWETAACVAIVAVGAAIVGLGTYSSVKQIVRRL
ncbi:amino acid transporter AVT1I-like [Oryza brachyantha]|uniref:Amino acid transporter transmembrane domain-containing protein n=1 Tax=Oryza brachyantha TaxID=4533 RepID=J3LX71_ORYBR|nr:amino acid transporter AVT1I-like [Oryza brachyantha]